MGSVRKLLPCSYCEKNIAVTLDSHGKNLCASCLVDAIIEMRRHRELGDLYELVKLAEEYTEQPCDH